MTPSTSKLPRIPASGQVLNRFLVRLMFLAGFAMFSSQGFGHVLAFVLVLMAIYCTVAASLRREAVFAPVLTHWDEAAGYALLHALLTRLA